jgi:hypothetical protein
VKWLVVAMLSLLPALAIAADKEGPKQAAAELVDEGNRFMKEGKFGAALARYQGAYELYPSPKLYFNFGEAERELGHVAIAAGHYEKFLEVSGVDPKSPLAQEAKRHLLALDAQLARVDIVSEPMGAEVFLDGRSIGRAPIDAVRVESGAHTILGQLAGFGGGQARIEVKKGTRQSVRLELGAPVSQSAPVIAPPPPKVAPSPKVDAPPPPKVEPEIAPPPPPPPIVAAPVPSAEIEDEGTPWWIWAGIGVVVVGAAVTAGIVASSGGDPYTPTGELGVSSTSEWRPN